MCLSTAFGTYDIFGLSSILLKLLEGSGEFPFSDALCLVRVLSVWVKPAVYATRAAATCLGTLFSFLSSPAVSKIGTMVFDIEVVVSLGRCLRR